MSLRFRVGSRNYNVRWKTPETYKSHKTALGTFQLQDGIELEPKQTPAEMASTIIHELIHGMWCSVPLGASLTEEQVCEGLEGPLLNLIIDNAHLRPLLCSLFFDNQPLVLPE